PRQLHVWLRHLFVVNFGGRGDGAPRGCGPKFFAFEKRCYLHGSSGGRVCTRARNSLPRSAEVLNKSKDDVTGEKRTTSPGSASWWARSTACAREIATVD